MEVDLGGDKCTVGFKKASAGAAAEPHQSKLTGFVQLFKGYGPFALMAMRSKTRLRRALPFAKTLLGSAWTPDKILGKDGARWSRDEITNLTSGRCGGFQVVWGFSSGVKSMPGCPKALQWHHDRPTTN